MHHYAAGEPGGEGFWRLESVGRRAPRGERRPIPRQASRPMTSWAASVVKSRSEGVVASV